MVYSWYHSVYGLDASLTVYRHLSGRESEDCVAEFPCVKHNRDYTPFVFCPRSANRLPTLDQNNPAPDKENLSPNVSSNVTALSFPGREVSLTWDSPSKITGYDGLYTTNTTAGDPQVNSLFVHAIVY